MNIIELIERQLDDRFTHAATNETGLSAEETRTTIRAGIPALLAALLGAITKPAGAKALGSMLGDQKLLGSVPSMLSGSGTQSIVGTGTGALTSLLGEGKLSSLANAVANFAGISQGQSRSVIGMLFPLVLGALGREQRGGAPNVDGIARMLQSRKHEIADAMPASVASSLRSTGMLDALDEEPMARRTTASATGTTSTPRSAARTQRPVQKNRSWFWPIAAGLAALALVVWGLTRFTDEPERPTAADTAADTSADTQAETTQIAAVAPSDIDLRVGGVDLREELTGVVDRAATSLAGVTDAASAEAALPTLSGLNQDLDGMLPLVDELPESARNAFSDLARTGYSRLDTEIDRIESIPAIPDEVKQVVSELGGKIESFFARGRG